MLWKYGIFILFWKGIALEFFKYLSPYVSPPTNTSDIRAPLQKQFKTWILILN